MSATYPMDMVRGRLTVQVFSWVDLCNILFVGGVGISFASQQYDSLSLAIQFYFICRQKSLLASIEESFMLFQLSSRKKVLGLYTKDGCLLS